jgi:hypothetical protein
MATILTLTPKHTAPQLTSHLEYLHIDAQLAELLGMPLSDTQWCCSWYPNIGSLLAHGRSFDEIRDVYKDEHLSTIIDWLEENYTVSTHREFNI